MQSKTLRKMVVILMGILTDYKMEGVENIPATGQVIIATNHLSRFDIPLLGCIPSRPDITALITDKYQEYPFFKWFTTTVGGIWIDRTKADFTAFRLAAEVLAEGKALGIAPEGTRSITGELLEGKPGTLLLAIKTGAPVVPVGISGTEMVPHEWKRLRRPRVVARFGKALIFPPLERENREAGLKQYTDEVMCQIAAQLPARYHGFYAGHPRLQEILALQGPVN
jgi:1-acyl-sn-glycerol-3-phosphate acyltransferase